eukprot:TRINITY_DN40276_c0_g1_i1.p1 TRINITY_DN40276_c0_g1~~TRINITY_DN40276_c0_g1_i1.p1  ORF type:complete len:106 (+),score=13.79 TRINITY_DN40276_c0_g1_i1:87-404(+)
MKEMANADPIPTSALLMSASRHIASRCRSENKAFLDCKKADRNPEKCLDKGHGVINCVFTLLKDLQNQCSKELDSYSSCMFYYSNEFEFCRKEQAEFEKACPLSK